MSKARVGFIENPGGVTLAGNGWGAFIQGEPAAEFLRAVDSFEEYANDHYMELSDEEFDSEFERLIESHRPEGE